MSPCELASVAGVALVGICGHTLCPSLTPYKNNNNNQTITTTSPKPFWLKSPRLFEFHHTTVRLWAGRRVGVVLGTMVCASFVLGGDANTGSAGYVCLETELGDGEFDLHAAMLVAFAFAAFLGLPSCFAVDSPAVLAAFSGCFANTGSAGYVCLETELVNGESDFHAAMHAAIAFAALVGWPSCFAVDSPAVLAALSGCMLCNTALSGFLRRLRVLAAMLGMLAALSTLWSLLFGAATLIAPLAAENTRLFILLEMVQVVFCAENWVPGSSRQEDEADFSEWVEVESYEPDPPCTMINNTPTRSTLRARRAGEVGASTSSCTTFLSLGCRRGCAAWRRT